KSPYELNVMHITVDGKPIDDLGRSSSDLQRCTDVALDDAKIRFHFDNLESRPRLAVAAYPGAVAVRDVEGRPAEFRRSLMYNNYASFIDHAEIRIFDKEQSLQDVPVEVVAVDKAGFAIWQPSAKLLSGSERELKYLLRAYDAKGHIDETGARPLSLYRDLSSAQKNGQGMTKEGPAPRELLAAYGENDLVRHQIPLGSGTVSVQGSGIPAEHTVWVAGHQIPIDPKGNFAAEQILPDGTHTVEVAVLDGAGNGS